jgi:hypothetical protein
MAKARKEEAPSQRPVPEARAREDEPRAQDAKTAEEPLDEQSLDRVMRDCPL